MAPAVKHILVVDDNPDILEYLHRLLRTDYTVYKAAIADTAITLLANQEINAIISDIMMPGMDGYRFCSFIKANATYCHIPVILLTAKNTLQDKIQGLEHGADAYIEKPFSPKYLKAQLSNLLLNRDMLKKHIAASPTASIGAAANTEADITLVEKFNQIISEHIDNPSLDIDFIAGQLNMSRSTFYRKTKGLFDMTPQDLITLTRLKKAARLMLEPNKMLNDICFEVGFNSYNYFSTLFHRQFNVTPTEFVRKNKISRA